MIGLPHYLFVSSLLAALGIIAITTRRNAVAILMGIELLLNAAALNFIAFSHYVVPATPGGALDGQLFAIFIIVLAAAEATVALAIIIAIYHKLRSINADELVQMKN
ncbi:MAG: NADH-quinone oxidoreductase subunit NuoK [bacterium]